MKFDKILYILVLVLLIICLCSSFYLASYSPDNHKTECNDDTIKNFTIVTNMIWLASVIIYGFQDEDTNHIALIHSNESPCNILSSMVSLMLLLVSLVMSPIYLSNKCFFYISLMITLETDRKSVV